ncbi:MAG: hypothetical protein JWO38_2647 [Gemmataceae bacterium]|nr:hypothetical protein [Gemmataceae bacterium]
MRTILGWAVVLTLAGSAGADDKPAEVDGKKLLGRWEPKDAKRDTKLTVEFTKDGKLNICSAGGSKEFKMAGTYKLDGNKLMMSFKVGGSDVTEMVTITKLTDHLIEGESAKGKKESFLRIKSE